jgi:hypothetical protein
MPDDFDLEGLAVKILAGALAASFAGAVALGVLAIIAGA